MSIVQYQIEQNFFTQVSKLMQMLNEGNIAPNYSKEYSFKERFKAELKGGPEKEVELAVKQVKSDLNVLMLSFPSFTYKVDPNLKDNNLTHAIAKVLQMAEYIIDTSSFKDYKKLNKSCQNLIRIQPVFFMPNPESEVVAENN